MRKGSGQVPWGSLGRIHPLPAAEESPSIEMGARFSSETGGKGLVATQLSTWACRTRSGGSSHLCSTRMSQQGTEAKSCPTPSQLSL